MKRLYTCISFVIWLSCNTLPAFAVDETPTHPPSFKHANLIIMSHGVQNNFDVEIAKTQQQQQYGLMFRKDLKRSQGMLFMTDSDREIRMWMKNTPLSLDMLFIDSQGTIVKIVHEAKPESTDIISSVRPVRAVLELLGKTAEMREFQPGDKIILMPYFRP